MRLPAKGVLGFGLLARDSEVDGTYVSLRVHGENACAVDETIRELRINCVCAGDVRSSQLDALAVAKLLVALHNRNRRMIRGIT